jgi:hypothetical protein
MVLLNAASKARNAAQTVNQSQGGGSKKAGFPYQVGRSSWSSIHIGDAPMTNGGYRKGFLKMKFQYYARPSRPIGVVHSSGHKNWGP